MHDVHSTCPLPPTPHNHKGWRSAPDAILPGHRRAPQWVPARTPTVQSGPVIGEAVGGPQQPPKGRSAVRTRRTRNSLSNSCVPVSVERLDRDKDADENVDADQIRTERPVESEQSIG